MRRRHFEIRSVDAMAKEQVRVVVVFNGAVNLSAKYSIQRLDTTDRLHVEGTFFDPIPEPWQIRELSHCLGAPFEVEANSSR